MYFGHIHPGVRSIETVSKLTLLTSTEYHLILKRGTESRDYFERLVKVTILEPKPAALAYLKSVGLGILGLQPCFALPNKVCDYIYAGIPIIRSRDMTNAISILGVPKL
jgi:hypothetical protein